MPPILTPSRDLRSAGAEGTCVLGVVLRDSCFTAEHADQVTFTLREQMLARKVALLLACELWNAGLVGIFSTPRCGTLSSIFELQVFLVKTSE